MSHLEPDSTRGSTALDPALDGLRPDDPAGKAANAVLTTRLQPVKKLLKAARRQRSRDAECVHQLRVAARRAASAIGAFEDVLRRDVAQRARRALRRIRRAAAAVRRMDVMAVLLRQLAHLGPAELQMEFARLERIARRERRVRRREMRDSLARRNFACLRSPWKERGWGRVAGKKPRAARDGESGATLADLAPRALARCAARLAQSAARESRDANELHDMRIAVKRFRDHLELFSACLDPRVREAHHAGLRDLQGRLGEIQDWSDLLQWVESGRAEAEESDRGSASLRGDVRDYVQVRREWLIAEFAAWRETLSAETLMSELAGCARTLIAQSNLSPDKSRGPGRHTGQEIVNRAEPPTAEYAPPARRVAAIDVGSNSIRLVVAEVPACGGHNVIDDEKETTRLGRGLVQRGRLSLSAIKRSVRAIARMRRAAENCRVSRLRAVATSAVREASNGREFVELVRRRTGVELEIIDSEYEARLSFASVSRAFDLDDVEAAIVDIGGGSTEMALSNRGVVEQVRALPLGAVRLADLCAEIQDGPRRYAALVQHVDRVIATCAPIEGLRPTLMIGAGGTFTTIAKVLLRRAAGPGQEGKRPPELRGFEVERDDLTALLVELRGITARERSRIPGISASRAEIIVEGLLIVSRLMRHMQIERLRIHDGGIRDGLIHEMLDEEAPGEHAPTARHADRLREAEGLAEECRFERAHSVHVAGLAVRLYDRLARLASNPHAGWLGPLPREWLHTAALLHDIGCRLGYERHHKHGYDLIVGGGLRRFTPRETEIIACVARYHRRSMPSDRHAEFARLPEAEREIVSRLAAILRIADGLDRSHRQRTRSIDVRRTDDGYLLSVEAMGDCTAELRAARRKADLFERVFGKSCEIRRGRRRREPRRTGQEVMT